GGETESRKISRTDGGRGGSKGEGNRTRPRPRVTVVALWTEIEVLDALRDMSKGRWDSNAPSGGSLCNDNPSSTKLNTTGTLRRSKEPGHHCFCCVQAFVRGSQSRVIPAGDCTSP
ncbi:unnamed protein product, partial [Sphacelaria rigidula]